LKTQYDPNPALFLIILFQLLTIKKGQINFLTGKGDTLLHCPAVYGFGRMEITDSLVDEISKRSEAVNKALRRGKLISYSLAEAGAYYPLSIDKEINISLFVEWIMDCKRVSITPDV
jgi:hypothetical protein